MAVTAALVKELRERTGAGMMECKKALVATDGDIEKAIEDMRKAGQAKAAKKAGRIAAEGVIVVEVSADGKLAAIIEINCETDFVARDENFNKFAKQVGQTAIAQRTGDVASLMDAQLTGSEQTVEQARAELVVKIGENINVRRLQLLESDGIIANYIHGNRIGVMVSQQGGDATLAKDIAMHIAASNPVAVDQDQVDPQLINQEREIAKAQAEQSGKPAEIVEKMVNGRVNKFIKENTLLGQPFVKDPNQSVADLLKAQQASVINFIRYEVGEGIEKKADDFVAEVMAQARGE